MAAEELGLGQHAPPPDVLEPLANRFQLRSVGERVHGLQEALPQGSGDFDDVSGRARHGP